MIQYNCICGHIVSYMNDLISKPRWLVHCAREPLFSKKDSFKIICPQIWKYTPYLHRSMTHDIKEFPHTWAIYVLFRMLFDITWTVSMKCKIHYFHVSLHCLRRERLDQDEDETKEKLKEEMNVEEETNEKTPLTDDTTVRMQRILDTTAGIILGIGSGNERWCYNVMSYLIGWAHTQNDLCTGLVTVVCCPNIWLVPWINSLTAGNMCTSSALRLLMSWC